MSSLDESIKTIAVATQDVKQIHELDAAVEIGVSNHRDVTLLERHVPSGARPASASACITIARNEGEDAG